jgi:hypothetical protein
MGDTVVEFGEQDAPVVYTVRGLPVVMDADVARLFDVKTGRLNEQVTRNPDKFTDNLAFKLTPEEYEDLKSQNATSSGHGGRRKPPTMFTEEGVVMAATVLKSARAVSATRFIVRTFVEAQRAMLAVQKGQNLPAKVDPRAVLPLGGEARHGLMAKLDAALGRVLHAIADPEAETTVREEARAVAAEGLKAIKDHLKKQGFENQKTAAEVQKLLKEAELLGAEITAKGIETEHRRLALVAKQLRVVLEIQRYMETGSADSLLSVLKELGG